MSKDLMTCQKWTDIICHLKIPNPGMQLPSCMTRWIHTMQRINGFFDIPLAIWCRKPLCSHCRWLVNARILVESQNNMQWVVSIHSTSTILTYRPWGQFGMWRLNGLDPSDSISKQACWICGVPICCDPVENNKSLTLISFLYLHWCRQLHRYQNHRPNDDADLVA
jgi:hypothetical protein